MTRSLLAVGVGTLLGFLLAFSSVASGQIRYLFYINGQRFLEIGNIHNLYQLGYAMGVLDGLTEAFKAADVLLSEPQDDRTTVWRTGSTYRALSCMSQRYGSSLTAGQARDIMVQYVRSRPQDSIKFMAELTAEAFAALCPP